MKKIQLLSAHEAQKIAAGEIIERPATIVKELLENAIDAGATRITIFIAHGGKKLIRVIDNGSGMHPEDAILCFARHATSKLHTFDELHRITTFGFRGEALASIAACGTITLITKETDVLEGTHVTVSPTTTIQTTSVAAQTGTDITVADIFEHIPARKKFLKADGTEERHIMQLVHAYCLSNPALDVIMYADDKQIMRCAPDTQEKRMRATLLLAPHQQLVPVDLGHTKSACTVHGFVGNHQLWRYDRSSIFIFVNNRWIKNQKLVSAVLKGYNNVLPHSRFPLAALFITVPADQVDINVHPRKEEVLFNQPRIVELLVEQAVHEALLKYSPVTHMHRQPNYLETSPVTTVFDTQSTQFNQPYTQNTQQETLSAIPCVGMGSSNIIKESGFPVSQASLKSYAGQDTGNDIVGHGDDVSNDYVNTNPRHHANNTTHEHAHNLSIEISEKNHSNYQLIGQFFNTYIIVEQQDQLIMIDQHAAHERILYEQFAQRFEQTPPVQLLFPQLIALSAADAQICASYLSLFAEYGITIEHVGEQQLAVHTIPVHLKHIDMHDVIAHTVSVIYEHGQQKKEELFKVLHEKLQAQLACKAAIKAGDMLTPEKMHELIRQLETTPNHFSCPHGRPTCWTITRAEIERHFKRRL